MTMVGWTATRGIDPADTELTIVPSENGVIAGSGELVTNGENLTTTTGWTSGNSATLSAIGNRLRVAYNAVANPYAYQIVTLDVAESFLMSVVGYFSASFSVTIGTTAGASDIYDSGTQSADFTSSAGISSNASCYINLYAITAIAGYAEFNFASIREEDFVDYSTNNLGMYVEGSLTASEASSGSELQMISGYTNANYVESTRGRFMPGSGDFYISTHFIQPAQASGRYLFMNGYYQAGFSGSMVWSSIGVDGTISVRISDDGNATNDTILTSSRYDDGIMHSLVFVLSGANIILYIDGVPYSSAPIINAAGSIDNNIATMITGASHHGSAPNVDGSLGPLRFGYYAPSNEQVSEWYKEDARLFKKYAPIQIVGEAYEMDVPHEASDLTESFDPTMARSYGGNSQTIITDEYDEYNLSTSILEDLNVGKFAAFLRSSYGGMFTYDELGTIAAPYEPVMLENVTPKRRRVRVGSLPRSMKFSYKARTV